ncbi:MAG: hypothetical protein ABIM20_01500 [candidate division WOR-3 bacterium]
MEFYVWHPLCRVDGMGEGAEYIRGRLEMKHINYRVNSGINLVDLPFCGCFITKCFERTVRVDEDPGN